MAGDPRSTRRFTRMRNQAKARAQANNAPCARPDCTLGPIRYDLGNNHPLSYNLGHITEIDRGGDPYDPANQQDEHCRCNAQAGARYRNNKHNPPRQSRIW